MTDSNKADDARNVGRDLRLRDDREHEERDGTRRAAEQEVS